MAFTIKEKIQLGIIGTVVLLSLIYLARLVPSQHSENFDATGSSIDDAAGGGAARQAPLAQILMDAPVNALHKKNVLTDIRNEQESKARQPWGRDPFFALSLEDKISKNEPAVQAGGLALSGISLRGSRAVAIVNHTIVHEGDEIFGMTVMAIKKDCVTFAQNGDEFVLHFGGPQ